MHDATKLLYQNPSDASQQRSMWSDCYGMACAKGGVGNETGPCQGTDGDAGGDGVSSSV